MPVNNKKVVNLTLENLFKMYESSSYEYGCESNTLSLFYALLPYFIKSNIKEEDRAKLFSKASSITSDIL